MAPPPSRTRALAVVLALACLIAACGDGDADEAAVTSTTSATATTSSAATGPDDSEPSDSEPSDSDPSDSGPDGEMAEGEVAEAIAAACSGEPFAGAAPPPDEFVLLLDTDGGQLCLGPSWGDRSVIQEATVTPDSVAPDFVVLLEFTIPGIDTFNELAELCFNAEPDSICPSSRVAIVVDDRVVSAPVINAPAFERDQIVIAGDFGQPEAIEVADGLEGPGLSLRPVAAELGPPTG